jgi:hypothetical protein
MDFVLLYWILVGFMVLGALGELIPGMPGASVILAAIVIWSLATGFAGIGWSIIVVFAILILSSAVEFLAAYWGSKQFGASRWGQFGAIVGSGRRLSWVAARPTRRRSDSRSAGGAVCRRIYWRILIPKTRGKSVQSKNRFKS